MSKKNLCDWSRKDISKKSAKLAKIVSRPKYLCEKCARSAGEEKYLCEPKSIK